MELSVARLRREEAQAMGARREPEATAEATVEATGKRRTERAAATAGMRERASSEEAIMGGSLKP